MESSCSADKDKKSKCEESEKSVKEKKKPDFKPSGI